MARHNFSFFKWFSSLRCRQIFYWTCWNETINKIIFTKNMTISYRYHNLSEKFPQYFIFLFSKQKLQGLHNLRLKVIHFKFNIFGNYICFFLDSKRRCWIILHFGIKWVVKYWDASNFAVSLLTFTSVFSKTLQYLSSIK